MDFHLITTLARLDPSATLIELTPEPHCYGESVIFSGQFLLMVKTDKVNVYHVHSHSFDDIV